MKDKLFLRAIELLHSEDPDSEQHLQQLLFSPNPHALLINSSTSSPTVLHKQANANASLTLSTSNNSGIFQAKKEGKCHHVMIRCRILHPEGVVQLG